MVIHFSVPLEILNILILKPLLMFFSFFHLICHEFISCCQVVVWLKVAWLRGCPLLCACVRGNIINIVSSQMSKSGLFQLPFQGQEAPQWPSSSSPQHTREGPYFLLPHRLHLFLLPASDPNRPAVLVSLNILHFLPFLVYQYL